MADPERTARQYDAMAADYSADNAHNASNSLYERPATIALLGDVEGLHVLDAGCGAGLLSRWLLDHGAHVTAIDVSAQMAELATREIGDRATVLTADLSKPYEFAEDNRYDVIVSSLALHYIRDWGPVLSEFRRVLKTDGVVVFSTHHPFMDGPLHSPDDYFAIKQVTEEWEKGSGTYEVTFWRRPLTSMCESIAQAGFVIERLVEPMPLAELEIRDPKMHSILSQQPTFLFFRLHPRRT
ncbi:MAG: class I SAM-dependent methyltransferase [Acidimicrobiales bacterium]